MTQLRDGIPVTGQTIEGEDWLNNGGGKGRQWDYYGDIYSLYYYIEVTEQLSDLEYKPTEVADRSILQFHTEDCQILSIIGVLNQVMKRRIMNKKRIGTLVQVLTKKSTYTMSSREHIM